MFGSLYLAIKVLVSGLSEIDITMLAEKLSVGRKRNVKVEEHGQFSVYFTQEKLDMRCLVRAPVFLWTNRCRVSTARIRGSAVVLLQLRNDLFSR